MDANTGLAVDGVAHLRQSVRDVLATPIGSRVMRRDYGSCLFELLDAPMDTAGLTAIHAAVAESLARWEPRLRLTRVRVAELAPGSLVLDLEGEWRPDGRAVTLEGVIL